jgi:hypothetical protein
MGEDTVRGEAVGVCRNQLIVWVSFHAVRKDRSFAGGSINPSGKMAVHDGDGTQIVGCDPLVR